MLILYTFLVCKKNFIMSIINVEIIKNTWYAIIKKYIK